MMKFLIVDAFSEKLFGGNPAGVVILPEGKSFPSDEIMVKTAAELRYSETAFISILGDNEFNIRYFTPAAEVDLCGHATVGAFCALAHLGVIKDGDTCTNHTLAGELKIETCHGYVMMDMAEPQDISVISDTESLEELYTVLGSKYDKSLGILPEIISTGLPDIMVPVSSEKALGAMAPDMKALAALSEKYKVTGVHAFSMTEEEGITAHTRNFAPLYDIDEEAATGTSSGALAYYLYKNSLIESNSEITFLQGEAMNRPSLIKASISSAAAVGSDHGKYKIKVGGKAVILAEGEINL
ncbi:MAG: PhzF family phenazine biosynthesis protein [Hornefia sp.]|nr:PhzF family phenazine biosynthesis protein [Hornefia sp.]